MLSIQLCWLLSLSRHGASKIANMGRTSDGLKINFQNVAEGIFMELIIIILAGILIWFIGSKIQDSAARISLEKNMNNALIGINESTSTEELERRKSNLTESFSKVYNSDKGRATGDQLIEFMTILGNIDLAINERKSFLTPQNKSINNIEAIKALPEEQYSESFYKLSALLAESQDKPEEKVRIFLERKITERKQKYIAGGKSEAAALKQASTEIFELVADKLNIQKSNDISTLSVKSSDMLSKDKEYTYPEWVVDGLSEGLRAYFNGELEAALIKLKPIAKYGHHNALMFIWKIYSEGHGEPQDVEASIKWIRAGAEQGKAISQILLGESYAKGIGVPQDDKEAAKWTRLAAEQGNASAQFSLGVMYANGQGVPEDHKEAYAWLSVAASRGHEAEVTMQDKAASMLSSIQLEQAKALAKQYFLQYPPKNKNPEAPLI